MTTASLQALLTQWDGDPTVRSVIAGIALAFLLGQAAAWLYMYTHRGVSYSVSFVQSIVLLTVIVTLAMIVIGNNVVIAFGLLGALSMIRFRNVLKDTRDTSLIFFSVVTGIACGTGNFLIAVAGTGLFCVLLLYMHFTSFGVKHSADAFLRFHSEVETWDARQFRALLRRHCLSQNIVAQHISEEGHMEMAIRLVMRDPARADKLVKELGQEEGISSVSFVLQTDTGEV